MSELPLEDMPDFPAAAHEAARGQVVYITSAANALPDDEDKHEVWVEDVRHRSKACGGH